MKVLVLGFYDRQNLGDDMFKLTLAFMLPKFMLTFACTDDFKGSVASYDAIICGGGDIINEYFIENIRKITAGYKGPILAVGIGISHESQINNGLLDMFDHVFTRNITDVRSIQKRLGSKYAHYLPDLGFLLTAPHSTLPGAVRMSSPRPRVGICLAHPTVRNSHFTYAMTNFIDRLSERYHIVLIAFNTSDNVVESDLLTNNTIKDQLGDTKNVEVSKTITNVYEMLDVLSTMQFIVAHRFHANIFSIVAAVPFLSIVTSRKTDLLVSEMGYPWMYKPEVSGNTFRVSPSALIVAFDRMVADSKIIIEKLVYIRRDRANLLATRKISAILLLKEIRMKRAIPTMDEAITAIYNRVAAHYKELCGLDHIHATRTDKDKAEILSQCLCFDITQIPGSKYVYGTSCNIKERPHDIKSMIDWIYKDHLATISAMRPCIDLDYIAQDSFKGVHRAGWQYVIDHMRSISTWNGVICDTYLDRTFHWGREPLERYGIIPYTSPWIGFVHHTQEERYSKNNVVEMVADPLFIRSLSTCRALVCLSDYLAQWFRAAIAKLGHNIPIVTLFHPTLFVSLNFRHEMFTEGKGCLVNVGAWYRNPWTIYHIDSPLPKKTLKGPAMENYFKPDNLTITRDKIDTPECNNKWEYCLYLYIKENGYLLDKLGMTKADLPDTFSFDLDAKEDMPGEERYVRALRMHIKTCLASVEILERLSNEDYDMLLSRNIIFLNLVDCSAANTIIESIVRCVPICLNRIPAAVEYLGPQYPLFYTRLSDIPSLLTLDNITKTHQYMKAMDKSRLNIDEYLTEFQNKLYPLLT